MEPFCKLADPLTYIACDWDLCRDEPARIHWISFFKRHLELILKLGADAATARGEATDSALRRAAACRREFCSGFDDFATRPAEFATAHGPITILTLDQWRDAYLRNHGFVDPFIDLKNRENGIALPLLPMVCRQLDVMENAEQPRAIIEGIFAGNIFDMGAVATAKAFLDSSPDFFSIRE